MYGNNERRVRLAELDLLQEERQLLIVEGRRLLLEKLLKSQQATADDVRAGLFVPPGIDARCLGAVPGSLARGGIIKPVGYVKSERSTGKAKPVMVWELADRRAAQAWLASYPRKEGS